MIAVDTNILLYAHRADCPQHDTALVAVTDLAEGEPVWGVPVFVIAEFLRVATHRKVFEPPSSLEAALAALGAILASPSARVLMPGDRFVPLLREVTLGSGAVGNRIHDASIAAVCLEWGVSALLTEDRDFERFDGIRVQRLRSA